MRNYVHGRNAPQSIGIYTFHQNIPWTNNFRSIDSVVGGDAKVHTILQIRNVKRFLKTLPQPNDIEGNKIFYAP